MTAITTTSARNANGSCGRGGGVCFSPPTVFPRLAPRLRALEREVYNRNVNSEHELLSALRRYWGYDAFRPLQERIVNSLLAGRDACVVMPTGGGKSLCYQLPAAMSPDKTVIVISPLIALMEDQVAQLGQMGIPAALLNSSISPVQQSRVIEKARTGGY